MRTAFGTFASCVFVVASLSISGMGDTGSMSPEKVTAVGVVRLLMSAEADYFHRVGRYATLEDLVKSGQLGKTATDAPENLRAFFALNLKSESDPVPGFILALDAPAEGTTYKLWLEQRTQACTFRLLTDEKAVVLEGKSAGCESDEVASAVPEQWAPPDIDEAVPTVRGDGPCPLPTIMQETSHRALELSENLQKFSAKERIEHRDVGKNGKVRNPSVGSSTTLPKFTRRKAARPISTSIGRASVGYKNRSRL